MSVEQFPDFAPDARQLWESIPADVRPQLLVNVFCGHCEEEATITNFSGTMDGADLVLIGKCSECDGDVARVIEGG
jgi:hypothetical protein